jgi:hypothetical protein
MFLLVVWLSPPIIAAIVQYTKPTRRLGLMVLSAGFLALLASNRWVPRHSPEIVGEIQGAVEHRIVPRITGYDAQQLTVTTDSPNEGRLVPAVVGARLFGLDNRPPAIVDWNPAADWGGAAAVAVVRGKVIGATQWNLQRGNRDISPTGDPRATWMIAWVRPRVAWRLTARDGEATRIGAESVQIEFVARDARTASYFVTERWPVGQEADRADVRRVDAYVLLAPDGASAVAADVHEIRALNSNGVAVVWRELRFRLPNGSEQGNAAALDGGVLVKVEFVSDRTFECTTPLDPRPNGRPF